VKSSSPVSIFYLSFLYFRKWELTIALLLLDAITKSSASDEITAGSSSSVTGGRMSVGGGTCIGGGISISDGIDGALRRVRRVAVESPRSEAGVLDTAEMLTSEVRVIEAFATSTLLPRCFLLDVIDAKFSTHAMPFLSRKCQCSQHCI